MTLNSAIEVDQVKAAVVETLGLDDARALTVDADTPLLGSLPELDSMAVLELVLELEQRFGITIEAEDVTADVFATLASLATFVDVKLRRGPAAN